MSNFLKLLPMYGYGWTGGQTTRETPTAFSVHITEEEAGVWKGVVTTPSHEFDGRAISMSQRHSEWDGILNVTLEGGVSGWVSAHDGFLKTK